jgi:hypothetical protein
MVTINMYGHNTRIWSQSTCMVTIHVYGHNQRIWSQSTCMVTINVYDHCCGHGRTCVCPCVTNVTVVLAFVHVSQKLAVMAWFDCLFCYKSYYVTWMCHKRYCVTLLCHKSHCVTSTCHEKYQSRDVFIFCALEDSKWRSVHISTDTNVDGNW